jgi:type II secretory pathway component PulF
MPIYQYKARDEKGNTITGRIDASGEEELEKRLESSGFFLVKFSLAKKNLLNEDIVQRFLPVTRRDLYTFTLQLANTVDSGVPILTSLQSISEGCKHKKLISVLQMVIADLNSGSNLSEALNRHPHIFSKFYTSMVELGEASGSLSKVLYSLAEYIKKEMEIKQRIIFAIIYPTVLVVAGIGLVSYLLIYVMPQFITIFEEEGVILPLPTRILLGLSNLISKHWYLVLAAIMLVVIGFKFFVRKDYGRLIIDRIKLRIPVIGGVIKKICVKRFIDSLYLLYASGLPILTALNIIKSMLNNRHLEKVIETLSIHMSAGKDLVSYLRLVEFFPPDILTMIKSGEESGSLQTMLDKISGIYHDEVRYSIEGLISTFEIGIILSMGIGVGFIATAILFPIFRLSRAIMGR